jgi:hypothetical protein
MPARGYSSTPSKKRPAAKAKAKVKAPPSEHASENAAKRTNAAARPNLKRDLANIAGDMAHKSGDRKGEQRNRQIERKAATRAPAKLKPVVVTYGLGNGPHRRLNLANTQSFGGSLTRDVGRTIANTERGIVGAVIKDPGKAAEKAAKQAGDIAKGVAATAIALPLYGSKDSVVRATKIGRPKGDSAGQIAKRMVNTEADRISKTYGPSFRDEPKARQKLQKQIEHEGALVPLMDMSAIGAPASLGLGVTARTLNALRVARGGKALKGVTRPPVRVTPHGAPVTSRPRLGAVRMVGDAAVDAARHVVQKVAVKRSKAKTTRAGDVREGKPLSGRRALLRPGEVTPISKHGVNRKLRLSVAGDVAYGESAATARVSRHVTSTKRGAKSVRATFKRLPKDDHHAAATAAQLGIRDAAGARAVLPLHIAEIKRTIAEARATATHPDRAAAMHGGHEEELSKLEGYLRHPEIFDHPDVQAAADAVRKPFVGTREGLSEDRAAAGRAGLVGPTLGVRTAREATVAKRKAYVAARESHDAAIAAKRAEVIRLQREVDHGRLRTREAAIGKGLGGKVRLGDTATLKAIARHAGKVSKRAPLARVGGHADSLVRAERGLRVAKQELSATRKARAKLGPMPRHIHESPVDYAARVDAAAASHGLTAPAHFPSKHEPDVGLSEPARFQGKPNPLRHERSGTLYRTGHQDKSLAQLEQNRAAALQRGARLEAYSKVLARHGKAFPSKAAAEQWGRAHRMDVGPDGDMVIHSPRVPVRKGLATPRKGAKSDAGDYVATDDVFVVPRAVDDELTQLDKVATTAPGPIRKVVGEAQSTLLRYSPSWWQFQRVNDIVAATIGGSILSTPRLVALQRALKHTEPDVYEAVQITSGGSMSKEMLTPHSMQKMGAIQRILDENPTYRSAFASRNPAAVLLRLGHDIHGALLHSDQAVTAGFRERQMLHNLQKVADRMNPKVGAIHSAFAPLGRAFAKGDVQQIKKLLEDPEHAKAVEDAAEQLNEVMGDWHTYTAREQRVRGYFAFYGFLRYATRMAFLTLPLGHPAMGALVAQLGIMGSEDAKRIVGPDMPWGIGALYNKDGTVAADFARANPLTGPLLSINKPEHLLGLMTPLASIVVSYLLNQPVGLSDSANGYIAQYDVEGNPKNHSPGGFLATDRLRIALRNVMSLITPAKEWQRFDNRQQSDDSLPWDRRYERSHEPVGAAKIEAKNKARGADGLEGLKHNLLPLAFPASDKNMAVQGKLITKARVKSRQNAEIEAAKRHYRLDTPQGRLQLKLDMLDQKLDAAASGGDAVQAFEHKMRLLDEKLGGAP